MELSGTIKKIFDVQEITATFKKREVVITTEDQYPQSIIIEFTQDKTADLDAFKEGDKVQININIRGREWINPEGTAKYFNSIQGWRISNLEQAAPAAPSAPANTMPPEASYSQDLKADGGEKTDDLPF